MIKKEFIKVHALAFGLYVPLQLSVKMNCFLEHVKRVVLYLQIADRLLSVLEFQGI